MGLFANFVGRVIARKMDEVAARAETAGARAVEVARSLVPVRTGRLRDSITFTWSRPTMTLTLIASEHYAFFVERRKPFMRPARAVMSSIFKGGAADIQFDTLPEKYHGRARQATGGSKRTIVGNRKRVKFKR